MRKTQTHAWLPCSVMKVNITNVVGKFTEASRNAKLYVMEHSALSDAENTWCLIKHIMNVLLACSRFSVDSLRSAYACLARPIQFSPGHDFD